MVFDRFTVLRHLLLAYDHVVKDIQAILSFMQNKEFIYNSYKEQNI